MVRLATVTEERENSIRRIKLVDLGSEEVGTKEKTRDVRIEVYLTRPQFPITLLK
jgi:hypothetical protein